MVQSLPHIDTHGGEALAERPIQMTPKAIEMAKERMEREGLEGLGLRVSVDGGGCSGFQYSLSFERPRSDDAVCEFDGLRVFVDAVSVPYLKGTTIDYVTGLHGAGFKFLNNPNATRTCGCGSSFSA
jgi:iron-sulfur cluster insertion protein